MSAPVVPSPLDSLRGRRFLLAPSIDYVEPNEWRLGFRTWGDIQMINVQTGNEIWVPRSCLGGLYDGNEDVMPMVVLKHPSRLQDGIVVRQNACVLQMPASIDRSATRLRRFRWRDRGRAEVAQIYAAEAAWARSRTGRVMWAAIATALVPAIVYALLLS